MAPPSTRARLALILPLVPVALLAAACQTSPPAPRQADIPGGRTLVRDGVGPDGDLVVATTGAPEECHAPEAWRRGGDAWREAARGPALAGAKCPPVTARLAADGRTLAVHDYSAGRVRVFDVAADRISATGTASIVADAGFAFPPPGPNLAFSGGAGELLLGSVNRGCRLRASGSSRACGLAELFERQEDGGWERIATFLPASERDGLIRFGQSVALAPDGGLALVGGTGEPGRSGALWVYAVEPGGPRLVQILAPGGRRREGWFANDLALSGDGSWLAVGGEQSVHLYERYGEGFAFRKLLLAPDAVAGHFGETVALSRDGRRLLVGAPRTACDEGERCGVAYLFERGRLWRLARALRPATEAADANFGHHLAISADGGEAAVQGRASHVFTLDGHGA